MHRYRYNQKFHRCHYYSPFFVVLVIVSLLSSLALLLQLIQVPFIVVVTASTSKSTATSTSKIRAAFFVVTPTTNFFLNRRNLVGRRNSNSNSNSRIHVPVVVQQHLFPVGSHLTRNPTTTSPTTRIADHTRMSFSSHSQSQSQPEEAQFQAKTVVGSSSNNLHRFESPSAERNKKPIWEVLLSKLISPPPPQVGVGLLQRHPINILEIAAGSGVHTHYFVTELVKERNKQKKELLKKELQGELASSSSLLLSSLLASPSFTWYPTDPSSESRESIQSYINDTNSIYSSRNVADPIELILDASGIMTKTTKDDVDITKQPPFTLPTTTTTSATTSTTILSKNIDLMVCINMIHISPWEATIGLMKVAKTHLRSHDNTDNEDDDDNNENNKNYTGGYLYCYGPYKVKGTAAASNLKFDHSLQSRNPEWGLRNIEDVIQLAQEVGELELLHQVEMPSNNMSLIFRRR